MPLKPKHQSSAIDEWRRYWTLPVAAALGYSAAVLHTYGIGPFIDPLQEEFGWSRVQISLGITIVGLTGATLSVPVGMLVDKIGPRVVGLTGAILMTSAFALLGTVSGSFSNWLLLWCVLAIANLGLQATVLTSAVASRFEYSRGVAFAVTFTGASLAASIFPVLAAWLIASYGWRVGFTAMGAIWLIVVFPFMFVFFRGSQDSRRPRAQKVKIKKTLPGLMVREGLRSTAFYRLLTAAALLTFTALGIVVHFVPILSDMGADPITAAGVASLIGVSSIIGRLGTGLLLDRLPAHIVGSSIFLLPIVACFLLLFFGAYSFSPVIAAVFFGFTLGAEIDVIAYLTSRHLGLKSYGVLFGVINSALALGVSFGPLAAGAVFDYFGSYQQFLVISMFFMGISSISIISLPNPQFGHPIGSSTDSV